MRGLPVVITCSYYDSNKQAYEKHMTVTAKIDEGNLSFYSPGPIEDGTEVKIVSKFFANTEITALVTGSHYLRAGTWEIEVKNLRH